MGDTTTLLDTISSPLIASLLSIHPNDVTHSQAPSEWSSWWAWASDDTPVPAWLQLARYFMRPSGDDAANVDIPLPLRSLVDSVRSLQLQRTPSAYDRRNAGRCSYRISPKKEHEVNRMCSYIHHMAHSDSPRSVWHAVDVGSGQGYLSRALQESDFHVLALDSNEHQTSGANRWAAKGAACKLKREHRVAKGLSGHPRSSNTHLDAPNCAHRGSLTHQTVHVCPRTLEESIGGWLIDNPGIQGHGDIIGDRQASDHLKPVPVTLVALHACGSLTVDVMRTFLSNRAGSAQAKRYEAVWVPHSLVVVGCCYNLMSPSGALRVYLAILCHAWRRELSNIPDFPLSKPLRDLDPVPRLTIAAVHLAAQVPSQWLRNEDTMRGAELALRKVVYRALLQPILQAAAAQLNTAPNRATRSERPIQPGLGETIENRRLGKLNDKAYHDWPTFLERATDKLRIDLTEISATFPEWFMHEAMRLRMERALFALQTLRCILGPLIETLIILDRRDWIQQELAEMNDCGQEVEVEMINLFDQSTGSGRNVAVVVKPKKSEQSLAKGVVA